MNKSALKKYAPKARLDFIAAVTRRAELLGLNPESPAKVEKQGEALLINGRAFPAAYGQMRTTLEARIRDQGFEQVIEAMAYTWFNRLVAVRYMELHGFLDHGYRVLSHPANTEAGHTQPEILDHIADLELPGLDKSFALELKLAGNKDEELYREVLLAQCHALHQAMPFLFESLDDATELLLPDGLLRTDSILGKLVTAIDEADWQDVEIIGWLYQFYISEKKDQVIGKVVRSEDIPAATQLFTPNWIVKYLVQNSIGRLWLMGNPTSQLTAKWEYYIKPAEQTEEVNAQLDALIQARMAEDGATLNPESLTLLDPACGSGHILVEAYDLLRDIYLERGYRRQDIPRLILEKNLYGLDIDDRAAQLAGFALLMKARADDRRLFGQPVSLNVLALQEAKAGNAAELHSALNAPQIAYETVNQIVETFEQAKTFGSLIQISDKLANALPNLRRELEALRDGGDMLGRDAADTLLRLVAQAEVLAKQFDAVVANPPYMGSRGGMCQELKLYVKREFPDSWHDLYSSFIAKSRELTKAGGIFSLVTMSGWMFLSTFSELRNSLLSGNIVQSLLSLGPRAFESISGEVVQACCFAACRTVNDAHVGTYLDLKRPSGDEKAECLLSGEPIRHGIAQRAFTDIPGQPVAFDAPDSVRKAFVSLSEFGDHFDIRQGLATTDNERFLRRWFEIPVTEIGFGFSDAVSGNKQGFIWFPFNKGGVARKWYGSDGYVVRYENDGQVLLDLVRKKYPRISDPEFVIKNRSFYFREGVSWTRMASGNLTVRYEPIGKIFDAAAPMLFPNQEERLLESMVLLNSPVAKAMVAVLNPSLSFQTGDLQRMPIPKSPVHIENAKELIDASKADWDAYEGSWDFQTHPLISSLGSATRIEASYEEWVTRSKDTIDRMSVLEERSNQRFIDAYGLADVLSPEVSLAQITLTANPANRYSGNVTEVERWQRFRQDTIEELLSFVVGCMMGRYSLDAPGLIYAHAGNEGFDPGRYTTFPADDDGIVPITDEVWFDDDGANRIREFVRVVWGEDTEAENMVWLAESLGSKASESADDTIRRYLSRDFYKDHLKTYKKRPIYWLFSSGKHKAFEALVYLHRYNAGTLSRMRMEYVVPLQSRMQARIDNLEQDIQSSTSSTEQKRFQKQKDKLIKQLDELRRFDENLRHYADQRIPLDLDDGVKVNYGKFGNLLAEVKTVTGRAPSKNDWAHGG